MLKNGWVVQKNFNKAKFKNNLIIRGSELWKKQKTICYEFQQEIEILDH